MWRATPKRGGIAGSDNASLPRQVHGRKKVGLTVQYSGFAAFGHPARQISLADRISLGERETRAAFVPSPGANDALHGREAEPADAPLKDDRSARDPFIRSARGCD
jgi:hypothetical protein